MILCTVCNVPHIDIEDFEERHNLPGLCEAVTNGVVNSRDITACLSILDCIGDNAFCYLQRPRVVFEAHKVLEEQYGFKSGIDSGVFYWDLPHKQSDSE